LLLQKLQGSYDVGLYRAASSFITPLPIVAIAFNSALLPLMSRSSQENMDTIVQFSQRSFRYMLLTSSLLTILLISFGPKIMLMAFGAEYRGSLLAFLIMVWSLPFRFVKNTLAYTLTSIGDQLLRTLAIVFGTVACIVCNILLIPRLGIEGAAASMLATEGIITFFLWIFLKKQVPQLNFWRIIPKPIAAAFVTGLAAQLLKSLWLPCGIFISFICFIVLLVLLRGLDEQEIAFVRRKVLPLFVRIHAR
jgi:O-antigen/teichoic acid export membrane protein